MPRNVKILDGTITVSGGTGEAYATINYPHPINVLRLVCINAPSDVATFDFLIRDAGAGPTRPATPSVILTAKKISELE